MPIFYRGAGINTYWYLNDPIVRGFTARAPGITASPFQQMHHIARSTVNSPFISLTRSYAVAWDYAILSSEREPTSNDPAYVYEIEIEDPLPLGLQLLDPVQESRTDVTVSDKPRTTVPARWVARLFARRC